MYTRATFANEPISRAHRWLAANAY